VTRPPGSGNGRADGGRRDLRRPRPVTDDGPRHVTESMRRVLGRMGAPASLDVMQLAFARWEDVAGEELARHLRPLRVRGATLVLGAEHPAWATRGRMEAEGILARLRELGDDTIERIEVMIERP